MWYEPYKMAAVRHFLKPGMTFIDVGGNKGDFALLAALITGENGTVLCFEPEPENCHWIRKSVELNGYKNITLHEIALSDQNGTAQLYVGRKNGWHTLLSGQEQRDVGAITVRTASLDGILEAWGSRQSMLSRLMSREAELLHRRFCHAASLDSFVRLSFNGFGEVSPLFGSDHSDVAGLHKGYRCLNK